MSSALFDPLQLRDLVFKNRLWVPPMCQYSVLAEDGVATDWHWLHYGALARGGVGGIIVEATGILPEGRISIRDLGLWNDRQMEALRPVAEQVKSFGARIGIQLSHAGRKASMFPQWGFSVEGPMPKSDGGWSTFAPSGVPFDGYPAPVELDQRAISRIVDAFGVAASRAMEAGFDFVELHGAHGYLIHEFLSPLSNYRDDQYGGDRERRTRFLVEVLRAVRSAIGNAPLLLRLSATDWAAGGLTVDDTIYIVRTAVAETVDLIDASSGGTTPTAAIPVGPGYQVPFATAISRATGVLTAAVGMIDSPELAEHIVATGLADVVLIGREHLRNPNFAMHAASTLRAEISKVAPGPYLRAYRR